MPASLRSESEELLHAVARLWNGFDSSTAMCKCMCACRAAVANAAAHHARQVSRVPSRTVRDFRAIDRGDNTDCRTVQHSIVQGHQSRAAVSLCMKTTTSLSLGRCLVHNLIARSIFYSLNNAR